MRRKLAGGDYFFDAVDRAEIACAAVTMLSGDPHTIEDFYQTNDTIDVGDHVLTGKRYA
jgi:hypothetical protein